MTVNAVGIYGEPQDLRGNGRQEDGDAVHRNRGQSVLNSLSKVDYLKTQIHSPFLQVYPDVGNLTAWPENDVAHEIESNIDDIVPCI